MVAELANASEVVPGAGIESSGEDHDLPDWTLALNRRLAAPAFLVTIVFLAAVHDLVMVVVGGDAIRLNRPAVWICLAVYVGFLLEFGIYWMANASRARGYFWSAVFPPVRATRTDLATGRLIWFPGAGWSPADSRLAAQASGAITSGFIVAVLALLVVVVTLVANGTSFQTLPNYSAFQWIMMVIWVGAVVECCLLFATVGRKMYPAHRTTMMIVLSPLFSAIVMILVRRVVLGVLARESIRRAFSNPRRRIAALERKIEDRMFEVELLQDRIAEERDRIDRPTGSSPRPPTTCESSVAVAPEPTAP